MGRCCICRRCTRRRRKPLITFLLLLVFVLSLPSKREPYLNNLSKCHKSKREDKPTLSFAERFSGTSAVSCPAELLRLLARDIGGDEDLAGGETLLRDDIVRLGDTGGEGDGIRSSSALADASVLRFKGGKGFVELFD